MLPNTAPFDATGHRAMSVPCGMGDGLPIGLMLIARHYGDDDLPRRGGLRKSRPLEKDVMTTRGASTFSLAGNPCPGRGATQQERCAQYRELSKSMRETAGSIGICILSGRDRRRGSARREEYAGKHQQHRDEEIDG